MFIIMLIYKNNDAKRLLEEARNSFPESFIIKMKNGERTGMIKP